MTVLSKALGAWFVLAAALAPFSGCATVDSEGNEASSPSKSFSDTSLAIASTLPDRSGPIAVMPYSDSQKTEADPTDSFGKYYADSLGSYVKGNVPQPTLAGRSLLQTVLQERGYNFQGRMTDEQLQNLGEFTPARYVLTGTYTVFSSYLRVTSRLLDIRDGHIISSKSTSVELNNNLRTLLGLEPVIDPQEPVQTAEAIADVPGAMPEASFHKIWQNVADQSSGADGPSLVTLAFRGTVITSSQCLRVMRTFSFDDGKPDTLKTF
jgi:TolB-like protein